MARPVYLLALLGSVAVTLSSFLPWLRLGDVALAGIPDPAGYFMLAVGTLGLVISAIGLRGGHDTRQLLLVAGLAGLTTLVVVWRSGPITIAERARARAEAVAIVDQVAVPPVPPVRVGVGVLVGLAGAAAIALAGLTGLRSDTR